MHCQVCRKTRSVWGWGRPEVGNGGSEDDPVSSEHILPDSQVHVAQFSLPSDVLHLHNCNDSLKSVDGLINLRKTEVWQILLVENCGIGAQVLKVQQVGFTNRTGQGLALIEAFTGFDQKYLCMESWKASHSVSYISGGMTAFARLG